MVGFAGTSWFGGCGAPATRSQTTCGLDAVRSRPSGLKLSAELESPVSRPSNPPAPVMSLTDSRISRIMSGSKPA